MWRTTPTDPSARAARLVTFAFTVAFALLVCRGRPWELFARGGFSNDFYDEQARSFLRLHLSVRADVAGIEGFLIDGKTYLYYGPLLAIARMPFALFGSTFAGRLTRVSMIAAYATLCTAAFHLVTSARHWVATTATVGRWSNEGTFSAHRGPLTPWRSAGFVAAVAASPALYMPGWVSVYHETELWAATFAAWAFVGMLRLHADPQRRHAMLAAAMIAAATLTRAPVGIGVAFGSGLIALMLLHTQRRHALIVIGGCVVGFLGHVAVNVARFGTLLGLPAERQVLSLTNPERAAWFAGNHNSFFGLRFLPTTLVQYLRPDSIRFERLLPVIRFGPLAVDRGSYPMETITPAASITTTATLLLIASVVGVVALVRHRAWTPLALTLGGIVAAVPTFAIGFVANRYLADMLPAMLPSAAVAFACVVVATPRRRTAARIGVVALVAWGTWTNVALALWTQNLKEAGFTEWRYRVDDVLFGNPAPALVTVDPAAPGTVPRDGVVGVSIDPDSGVCAAVHIAEQGRWVALERTNGAMRLSGTVAPRAGVTVTLADGPTWSLTLTASADDVVIQLIDGEDVTNGDPVTWSGGAIEVEVVVDPLVGETSVTVNRVPALFRFGAVTGPPRPGTALQIEEGAGDTLCRRLADRR